MRYQAVSSLHYCRSCAGDGRQSNLPSAAELSNRAQQFDPLVSRAAGPSRAIKLEPAPEG